MQRWFVYLEYVYKNYIHTTVTIEKQNNYYKKLNIHK